MKKILYIDMDNVIVNFKSGIDRLSLEVQTQYEGNLDEVPGIFALMEPMEGMERQSEMDSSILW